MLFARVVVNHPGLSGVFDYHLPPELEAAAAPGLLVNVPFGRQTVQGVILSLQAEAAVAETRPVLAALDPQPVMTAPQLALLGWMAERFLQPVSSILPLFLPAGLSQFADSLYALTGQDAPPPLSATQRRLLTLLAERGPLRGRQIDRALKEWRPGAEALVRRGVLRKTAVLPPPTARPRFVRTAQLAAAPATVEAAMDSLGKTPATLARRQAALRMLLREPGEVNVSWVYAESGCNLADLQELAERELISLRETEVWRDPLEGIQEPPAPALTLTEEQQAAWDAIRAEMDSPARPILLHGVTGSGKTELYLRAAEEVVRRGGQALVLVPEIALTPQTVRRFLARFPGRVGLVHSRLSDGERYDTWRRARLGLLSVVIGPRSALFTPLPGIGLIVVDECHDGSYAQSEPPFYHAVQTAKQYARLCGALCLLGSATPPVAERYQAGAGESRLVELTRRVVGTGRPGGPAGPPSAAVTSGDLPPVQVVDMRAELKAGERGVFSRALRAALERTLGAGQQAILFLNRRGTATYVFCRDCGASLRCPRCETPLILHTDLGPQPLHCHRCGYARGLPKTCPACGSRQIRAYGLGTEKVEAEVQAQFPRARVLRWDRETTREKNAHEIILAHFAAGRADVLIGTQMLAKGLDLPRVTLVGMVLADVGLNLPDPFAVERVFQVLTQVAGRAGRGPEGGQAILQTYQPEAYAIQFAARHDYAGFYERELANRRALGYPPFARLARLETRDRDPARAQSRAESLARRLQECIAAGGHAATSLIGPAPCFFAKVNGLYRWQVVVRGPQPADVLRGSVPDGWRVEVDPVSLL